LLAYTLLGAVAGAAGAAPAAWFDLPVMRFLPWVLVLYFFVVAFQLGQRLPRLALLGKVQSALRGWGRGRSGWQVALIMGGGTPLLPCGPLYFLVTLAGFSGSALRGAELMLAFGLGTVPLLWLAQANFGWLRARLSPPTLTRMRTTLALISAMVLMWRLRADLGFIGPSFNSLVCH
jgi:sulfite exporter TauE/SafE